jgi:hypothetical protein
MKPRIDKVALLHLGALITLALTYWLCHANLGFMIPFSYASFILIPGMASLSALMSFKECGRTWRGSYFRIWMYFSLGTLVLFVGEVLCVVNSMGYGIPSLCLTDIYSIAGSALFAVGLAEYFRSFGMPFLENEHLKMASPALITFSMLFSFIALKTSALPGLAAYEKALDVSSLLLGYALTILGILSIAVFAGQPKARLVYLHLVPGVMLFSIADLVLSHMLMVGRHTGSPLEAFFLFSYLMISLAFYFHRREFRLPDWQKPSQSSRRIPDQRVRQL